VRFVTLIGNPKAGSRTAAVAQAATKAVISAAGVQARQETVDLSALACRLLLPEASALIEDAVEQVLGADVLVVVSPVFKATYTGLLKVFFDRLGFRALATTVALPVLVMKHPEHALAVEVHMRPLLAELGATVPTPGLAVMESDLGRLDHVLIPWARRMAGQVNAKAAALASVAVPVVGTGPAVRAVPAQGGKAAQVAQAGAMAQAALVAQAGAMVQTGPAAQAAQSGEAAQAGEVVGA
jgi:FMN reductase